MLLTKEKTKAEQARLNAEAQARKNQEAKSKNQQPQAALTEDM